MVFDCKNKCLTKLIECLAKLFYILLNNVKNNIEFRAYGNQYIIILTQKYRLKAHNRH